MVIALFFSGGVTTTIEQEAWNENMSVSNSKFRYFHKKVPVMIGMFLALSIYYFLYFLSINHRDRG